MRIMMSVVCWFLMWGNNATAQLKEPYKKIHGGAYSAPFVQASPDPLIRYRWKNPKAADSLQLYFLSPKKMTAIPERAFKQSEELITVFANGDLMLDAGTENAGWIEFDSNDLTDSVQMSISEYNEPAIVNAGAQNPVKTKTAVKHGNTYRLQLNDGLYEGVRFAWIHVRNFSKIWHIKNIRLVCQVKPVNYKGSFYTNDTMLNRIWYTGAYVVKLNMLQEYFGAILMERSDRHSWTGDAYPAQAAALAAFGNYDGIKKNIAFTADQDNGIAAYSIYWVLSLIDYYNYTGDTAFLRRYATNAGHRLEKAWLEYDTLPNLGFMGWDERLGAGFENTQIEEAQYTYKLLCINGWKNFARLMASINEPDTSRKYQQFAESKTRQLMANQQAVNHYGIHAVSEGINAGFFDDEKMQQLSIPLFTDRLNRLSYSPFNQYFIIQAMAKAKQYTVALQTIADCWGGQIMYGGTSFFEVYRPSWNAILNSNDAPPNNQCGYTSLAHPWGAGVTKWLSENILGIQPVQAGFKTFTIIPFLQNKLTEVKGTMPTPFGSIKAAFNIVSGKAEITIPRGTIAEKIGLPRTGRQIKSITLSRQEQGTASFKVMAAGGTAEDEHYIYLTNLQPGHYKIAIDYGGLPNTFEQAAEPFNYPVHSFAQDSLTSGNWQSRYGNDGHVFFGYRGTDSAKKIPAYADSIILRKNGVIVWDSTNGDNRALIDPALKRQLTAAIITRDPIACEQTMTIDIAVKDKHPYRLSVYFLDWDKKNRRSAIELFDLATLNIIAPVQLLAHYENGKYLRFTFDRSIRIRINQVRGQNAAVSGIFFDSP